MSLNPSKLWDLGYRTLHELRRSYGFAASEQAGLYSALFGRDSLWMLILILEAARLRSADAFLAWAEQAGSDILSSLCALQGTEVNNLVDEQPGKIIHEYHEQFEEMPTRVSGSGMQFSEGRSYSGFDQTFLFITAFKHFADLFPANPLADQKWKNLNRALEWIEGYGDHDGDGLFEYHRRHPNNLLNQVWKDSFDSATHTGFDVPPHPIAWIEVQAYAFRAFQDAATLLSNRGDRARAEYLAERAAALRRKVNDLFWLESEKCLAIALDGVKRPVAMISSNAAHALWAGIVEPSYAEPLVRRLMRPDMMTPYGLRTLSASSPYYAPFAYHRGSIWPFDNAVFAAGLLELGYEAEARAVIEAVGVALLNIGSAIELYAVLDPELFVTRSVETPTLTYRRLVPENISQGWTAAALLYFGAALAKITGKRL